jgi:hypothetical protein
LDKTEPFSLKQISTVWLKLNILKSQKSLVNILINFYVFEVFSKNVIFDCDFDDNLSVTHVFTQQIFRPVEQAPLPPLPPRTGQGLGEYWMFSSYSHIFGYDFEAVGIRVKCC